MSNVPPMSQFYFPRVCFPSLRLTFTLSLMLLTGACSLVQEPVTPVVETVGAIKLNQLGFLPDAQKRAVVPDTPAKNFSVVDQRSGAAVFNAPLGAALEWVPAQESVKLANFSEFKTPGKYRIRVKGLADSPPFSISADEYVALNGAVIKAFYYNRAGMALTEQFAGVYARAAGHADTQVLVHASAATQLRPVDTAISAPKGWYDAGDYNKYVVNSGITTYTLLAAFEHFPDYYAAQNLHIPESGDAVPDLLNEIFWNLDWMLAMQDPDDGGVYHKLTEKNFSQFVMPSHVNAPRYVVQKTTAAALNFAAVMAMASRVFAPYNASYPGYSAKMLVAAEKAWVWASRHSAVIYEQPDDIKTGKYGDNKLSDEFAWAAAELYIATKNNRYYVAMNSTEVKNTVPSWSDVRGLAWMSLAQHRTQLTALADQQLIASRIDGLAADLLVKAQSSGYGVPMQVSDFIWGSNAVAANQAMMLIQGFRLNGNRQYLDAAQSLLDYLLGRNATGYSFVTGFGAKPTLHPHHRPSGADAVAAPVPGFLVGGPQPDQQDASECPVAYPTKIPAKSYVDHECSYASNEVAINWNAPLVYLSGALQVLTR